MAATTTPSSNPSSYEEQKKKSILEFCQEDPQEDYGAYTYYPFEPDVWECGKKDFATQLFEKEEQANENGNDGAAGPIPIPERYILKVLWIVELLRRKKNECSKLPSPTLLKHPTDALPSIVSNIKLIGTFNSGHWMEGFDGEDCWDYSDGKEYRVVDFDITVADGSVMKLNAVVNVGNADANTGYWGGVFVRDSTKMVAIINGLFGDCDTVIKEVPSNLGAYVPFSDSDLDFLTSYFENVERREEDYKEYQRDIFYQGSSPGTCGTQFEKIIGMVMDRFMTTTDQGDWDPELKARSRVKRPSSAFFLFSNEMRPIIRSENPNQSFGGVARLLSARYKALSTEERKKYDGMVLEDKKRYKRELEEYDASKPSDGVERLWKLSGKNYGM